MKYERKTKTNSQGKEEEIRAEYGEREGVEVKSKFLSAAKRKNPSLFHDLRAVRYDDGGIAWVHRELLD